MSPTLHNWGFGELGIDAIYKAWPMKADDLPAFMDRFRREPVSGASVTIPHKQAVMKHLDHTTDRARAVGAVNTLYWEDGTVCGENTDVIGLIAPLQGLESLPDSAIVLGAGGAARAAVVGLQELGIGKIMISNRTRQKADQLAACFSIRSVAWENRMSEAPGLILNTTPLGMSGDMQGLTPWAADLFPSEAVVYDIVYNPLETRFLREARSAGCATISGLEMFLHQGLAQFRIWTGKDMDTNGARDLLLAALNS